MKRLIIPFLLAVTGLEHSMFAAPMPEGLVLHLDARAVDGAGKPTPTSVAVWKDLSGKGNDVQQADAAAQPHWQAEAQKGSPAMIFSGKEWLDGPAVLPKGAKTLTFAAVWEREAAEGAQVVVEQAAPGNGRRASLLTAGGAYGFNGEFNDQHGLMPFMAGQFTVSVLRLTEDGTVTLMHNGATKKGRIDGAKQNTGADKLRVGGKIVGGELLNGAVSEILVYDRALSDVQLSQLSAELGAKWGIEMDTRDPAIVAYDAMIRRDAANPARYNEPYRQQYHYTPIEGWVNDPNGLSYFNGEWHFFAQHQGWFSQQQAWGHAVSRDLLHWEHRPPAIMPDELGAIWSGSAVVDVHDTSGLFNGKPGLVCIFTYCNPAEDGRQSQGMAYSADGKTFTTYAKNPIIPQLRYQPGQPDDHDFRDPKVFWHEPTKRWIMVVAGGTLRFYSSPNLRDWTFESINNDIHTECPDFFPMPLDGDAAQTRWVLSGGGNWYRLGSFDGHKFTPEGDNIPFHYGRDLYASQSFNNAPDGRRIMISWLYNWGYQNWPTKPWSGGGMTLPYELKLRQTAAGPRIFQMPVKEVQTLRGAAQSWENQALAPGTNLLDGVKGKALEIEAEFDVSGAATSFGFKIPKGGGEQTVVGYRSADKKMFVDRRGAGFTAIPDFNGIYEASLPPQNNRVKLHLFLDWSSVELFGNDGGAIITAQTLADPQRDGLELFAEGGEAKLLSLKIYPLKSVWRDEAK